MQQIWGLENDSQSPQGGGSTGTQSPQIPFVQGSVYRLSNASTGRFLFSANSVEIDILTGQGWSNEGIAFKAATSGSSAAFIDSAWQMVLGISILHRKPKCK